MNRGHAIPAERRRRILSFLQRDGWARVTALSEELGTSEVTIRRDLDHMETEGLLERTRGGAILTRHLAQEPLYIEKDQHLSDTKERIGRLAASLVHTGETVFVNSGSTNRHVLRALNRTSGLRIITTNAAAVVDADGGSDLIVTGGRYRPESKSFVGPFATQVLRQAYADRAFIGVDGVSLIHGLTTPNQLECENARLMIRQTIGSVVVVADHTKIGVVAKFVVEPLTVVSTLVTDQSLSDDLSQSLEEAGIQLLIASDARGDAR